MRDGRMPEHDTQQLLGYINQCRNQGLPAPGGRSNEVRSFLSLFCVFLLRNETRSGTKLRIIGGLPLIVGRRHVVSVVCIIA